MTQDGLHPIWQSRREMPGFVKWDILNEAAPTCVSGGVILCLLGGNSDDLGKNQDLAIAACEAGASQGARHVFLASSSAVYSASQAPLSEEATIHPQSKYGAAKREMELAVLRWADQRLRPGVTLLRIGNVAGFDALLGGAKLGTQVVLDPVPGTAGGPVRSYLGPLTLAAVLRRLAVLAAHRQELPQILNLAAPEPVTMASLLDAAGMDWDYGPINPLVVPKVILKTCLLQRIVPLPHDVGRAASMVAEWRGLGS